MRHLHDGRRRRTVAARAASVRSAWRRARRPLLAAIVCALCSGCSTIGFSRTDALFDGSVHAASGLVCSGYWSGHDIFGEPLERTTVARVGATLGLIVYGLIDLPFSMLGDVLALVPNAVIRGGPPRAAFDVEDHEQPWRCATRVHSIRVITIM